MMIEFLFLDQLFLYNYLDDYTVHLHTNEVNVTTITVFICA